MKTSSFLGLLLVSSILLFSCKKEVTTTEKSSVTETQSINYTNSLQPVKTDTEKEVVALNPAHGQPNHRCDIAVGAPLNSLPTPSSLLNSTPQTPTNNTNTSQTPNNNTGVKPATNPAHGQPYHRCDLKVGDPLPNS
ncbi:MAG: hypothetical protein Q8S44_08820 [Flavobacteriaceae bacterium]|nr:hypothetical protein [Flavobacteriaceae bacterium]